MSARAKDKTVAGVQISPTTAAAAAAVVGFFLLQDGAQRIVKHPAEEFGHPAVMRHEREISALSGGLEKLAETLKALEQERVQREERDRQAAIQREKERDETRRAEWRAQAAERDAKLIEALRQSLPPAGVVAPPSSSLR